MAGVLKEARVSRTHLTFDMLASETHEKNKEKLDELKIFRPLPTLSLLCCLPRCAQFLPLSVESFESSNDLYLAVLRRVPHRACETVRYLRGEVTQTPLAPPLVFSFVLFRYCSSSRWMTPRPPPLPHRRYVFALRVINTRFCRAMYCTS